MNILVVSAVLPYPLYSGGQIRMYNLLKRLSLKHKITLVSFIRDEKERVHIKDLSFLHDVHMIHRGRAWQLKYILRALVTRVPFLLSTYTNGHMHSMLTDLLKKNAFDLIHLEPFYVWPSIPNTTVPIVVSEHNVEHQVYEDYVKRLMWPLRILGMIDVSRLKRWEQYVWRKVSHVTTVSENDKYVVDAYLSFDASSVVSNGVDTDVFAYQKRVLKNKKNFLFVGNFRWLPNINAAQRLLDHIWPKIKDAFPDSTLTIVGRDMPESLVSRATSRVFCKTDVLDIKDEYANAFALLAPMTIAGGTKFKVLEAFASGLPVVSTKEGVEGIACADGQEVLLADTPKEFVDQLKTLDTNEHGEKLTKAARILVEKAYNWDSIAKSLDSVWRHTHEKK